MFGCMETPEALAQRVHREQQLIARLRLATTRLADADRERIWAKSLQPSKSVDTIRGHSSKDPMDCT